MRLLIAALALAGGASPWWDQGPLPNWQPFPPPFPEPGLVDTEPTPTFQLLTNSSGNDSISAISNISIGSATTINSQAVSPALAYVAADVSDPNTWTDASGNGATLTLFNNSGAGTSGVEIGRRAPTLDAADKAIAFSARTGYLTDFYKASDPNDGAFPDNSDFFIEILYRAQDYSIGASSATPIFGKVDSASPTTGMYCFQNGSTTGAYTSCRLSPGNSLVRNYNMVEFGAWTYMGIYRDGDYSAAENASFHIYVNGSTGDANADTDGTGFAFSDVSDVFTLGGSLVAGGGGLEIAFFSMYVDTDGGWFAGASNNTDWLAHHQARFHALQGLPADIGSESTSPALAWRTTPAYVDIDDGSGNRQLFYVGDSWMRASRRNVSLYGGAADMRTGFVVEAPAITNLVIQSADMETSWTATNVTVDETGGAKLPPNDIYVTDVTPSAYEDNALTGDANNVFHNVSQVITATAATMTAVSVFATPGDKNWIYMDIDSDPNNSMYCNVSACKTGTLGDSVTQGLAESYGAFEGATWCRCSFIYTTGDTSETLRIGPANANSDNDFAGDGATVNTYLWGAQFEHNASGFASTYIPTKTAGVARAIDQFYYDGLANVGQAAGSPTDVSLGANVLCPSGSAQTTLTVLQGSDGGSGTDFTGLAILTGTDGTQVLVGEAGAQTVATASQTISVLDGDNHYMHANVKSSATQLAAGYTDSNLDGTTDSSFTMTTQMDRLYISPPSGFYSPIGCMMWNYVWYGQVYGP